MTILANSMERQGDSGADRFHDECGLMACWNHPEAANICYLGLFAQQHRGQEGAGVVSVVAESEDPGREHRFSVHRGLGLVPEVFGNFDFSQLPGSRAVGHVRYSTAGGNRVANVQPFFAEISGGEVAVAHNGNLINAEKLRRELISGGAIFSATSDTEVFLHLLARTPVHAPFSERLIAALQQVQGAYSLIVLRQDRLFAVRDPHGLRPLVLAKLNGSWVIASESCAFDLVNATFEREVQPGELVEILPDGELKSYFPFARTREAACVFEYIYFARPDSIVFGRNVYAVRKRLGEELAREAPVPGAEVVVPVLDSGVAAAIGYSQASGIALELGLIRNHYVGRTFIEPKQSIRDFGVKIKLNANPAILSGKSIVVVDDSLVRGTTSRKLVKMLRQSGAKEVHLRISAPPTIDPCYYGIDTPEKSELIASHKTTEEIRDFIGVDSLAYLSLDGVYRAVDASSAAGEARARGRFCDACFSGHYPIGTPKNFVVRQKELF